MLLYFQTQFLKSASLSELAVLMVEFAFTYQLVLNLLAMEPKDSRVSLCVCVGGGGRVRVGVVVSDSPRVQSV